MKISYEEMKEACSNEELSDESLEGVTGGRMASMRELEYEEVKRLKNIVMD